MTRHRIRLLALGVAGLVVLIAIGTHFLLPPYLEGRVEERLEEHGGRAEVELSAVPAIRLLTGHGDRLEVTGSGLEVDFQDPDEDAFEHLNKFDEVDIELTEIEADPFEVSSFRLEAVGDETYSIEMEGTVTPQALGREAGERFGPLGGLIGSIVGGTVPGGAAPVPVRLDGEFRAEDGEVEMVSGDARVAGLPAGPLARLVTNAILSDL